MNAEDPRYRDLVGRQLALPLTGRTIPVIADEHADPEQGTGAVKITPAHDFNDHAVGLRHGLVPLDVMTPDGRMNDAVPEAFRGLDRFEARARAVEALEALGAIEKIEPKTIAQPFGDRSGVVLEPRITDQWFMKTEGLAAAAASAVRGGETRFVPGQLGQRLLSLDGQHRALVHQPPALVRAPDPGLVRRGRRGFRRRGRRGGPGRRPCALRAGRRPRP